MSIISNKLSHVPAFGHTFFIVGRLTRSADRFEINFSNDKLNQENIPFHLSFRLREKLFVRNSKVRRAYLQEERVALNNLKAGKFVCSIYIYFIGVTLI